MTIVAFQTSTLLNYYYAKLPFGAAPAATAQSGELPPWDISKVTPPREILDVSARSSTPYFDPGDRKLASASLPGTSNSGSQIEALVKKALSKLSGDDALDADNHKLFGLYQALYRLDHIANMANREETADGQLPGLNASFQQGLSEIRSFVGDISFNALTLMAGSKSASAESSVVFPAASYGYTGKSVAKQNGLFQPLPGVSATDAFTVSVTKAGTTTDVVMNLSGVTGGLTLDNIDKYVNQQLENAGFGTRFKRVQTGGSIAENTASWGIGIENAAGERVTLSSSQAKRAIYVAGSSGAGANEQGKLIKLDTLANAPQTVFSVNVAPDDGTTAVKATAVDNDGSVYLLGDSTGSFGNQINQASRDVLLTKYDSAGKLQWTRLLGSAQSANAYALEVDPTGGVVVAGSVSGKLAPASVGGGSDSFVAKYDKQGNRSWLRHVAPVANDRAMSLLVDSSGNVYVGGELSGTIAAGQTSAGGIDAYVTKLSDKGGLLYHRQFGTSGADSVAAMGFGTDGKLIVASVQNGHAVLNKFDGANGTSAALWEFDLGDLEGGTISGMAMSDNQIYISGTTKNAALDAGGAATIENASSGGTEAFIFRLTDRLGAGGTQTPKAKYVTYVGTGASEQGGGLAISNGKLYLAGTTTGTFAGETRTVLGTQNMFVTRLDNDGTVEWTRQYGGRDAQSKGLSVAVDAEGSSVLDALGLPRGELDDNQSGLIESQSTVRAGDYFTMNIKDRSGTRSAKIVLGNGDTLNSLAIKINAHLQSAGKATAISAAGGQKLRIAVNPGVQVQLIGGPKDFDALAGLGMKEQLLVNDGTPGDSSSAKAEQGTNSAGSGDPRIVGLGIAAKLDLLSKTNAAHAHSVLQGALSVIKQAYAEMNNPQSATQQTLAPGSPYLRARLANYQTALNWLSLSGGTGWSV